jgi:tRNA isopentenyl-2-thiomethyl-A-37 hydroxylase MiaE
MIRAQASALATTAKTKERRTLIDKTIFIKKIGADALNTIATLAVKLKKRK